jgi:hypothetical protein
MDRFLEITNSTQCELNIWDETSITPYVHFANSFGVKCIIRGSDLVKIIIPIADTQTRAMFKLHFGE